MSRREHPIWEEELMPYVDGQLDADQATAVAQHLETCEDCAAAVADARGLSQQMASWTVENSSQPLTGRVLAELRSRKVTRPRQRWASWGSQRAWTYGLGGALAATVLVAVFMRNPGENNDKALVDLFEMERPAAGNSQSAGTDKNATLQRGQQGQQGQQGQEGTLEQRFRNSAEQGQAGLNKLVVPAKAPAAEQQQVPTEGPMIIRTSHLTVVTKDFDGARSRIEAIVRQSQGYLDQLTARGEAGTARILSASLRLPSDRVDSALIELRKIGKVREESQNSSDVTSQYVDLRARLSNAHNTEQRLLNLLRERTGKLEEVVNAERELSRVREEIERMEAQQKDMMNRVQYATIAVEVSEEYRAEVEPSTPSAGTRLRNALIDGYHGATETVLGMALLILRYGPALLLWFAVLLPFVLLLRRRSQSARQG